MTTALVEMPELTDKQIKQWTKGVRALLGLRRGMRHEQFLMLLAITVVKYGFEDLAPEVSHTSAADAFASLMLEAWGHD